jgi:predicted metal-dependent hydrolase
MQIDQIIRSKRKTIAIEVLPGGKVIVRAPLHASNVHIFSALQSRAAWLQAAKKKMAQMDAARQPRNYVEGELFWYLGREYPLHLVDGNSPALRFDGSGTFLLSRKRTSDGQALFIAWYREKTRNLVSQLIARYQSGQAFQVGSVRITSAKTRWGSCSGKNNLNFTYRLSMAPPSAVEYVVVHELMHTRIKNHSPQFWHAVEAVLPHWKKERVWLRKNGLKLTLD